MIQLYDYTSGSGVVVDRFIIPVDLPKGLKPRVSVGATSCVLTIAADGTIVIFR